MRIKWILLTLLLIPCWVIAARFNVDLVNLHYVSTLLVRHDYTHIYAYNGSLGRYFYGPFSLLLIEPLGHWSYEHAKWLWIALQTISYLIFWVLLARLYPVLRDPRARWGWIFIWVMAINPIHNNFQSNNIQLMLAVILVGAELLAQRGNGPAQFLGGLLCVLTGAIKVFPLFIAVYYLVVKPRAVKAGVLFGLLACTVAPFLYFGWTDGLYLTRAFAQNLGTYHAENSLTQTPDILCLPSLLIRWFGVEGMTAKLILAGLGGAFFLYSWYLRPEAIPEDRRRTHLWALALAVMTILSPSTRPHYFIFFIPGFCSLVEILYRESLNLFYAASAIIAGALIALTAQGVVGKTLNDQLEGMSVPTVGMLVLCVALVFLVRRKRDFYISR